jgi:hypothetical protein
MVMTDERSVADRMVFREVTHDNWRDFEGLFECRGGPKGPRNNKFPLIGLTPTSRATR